MTTSVLPSDILVDPNRLLGREDPRHAQSSGAPSMPSRTSTSSSVHPLPPGAAPSAVAPPVVSRHPRPVAAYAEASTAHSAPHAGHTPPVPVASVTSGHSAAQHPSGPLNQPPSPTHGRAPPPAPLSPSAQHGPGGPSQPASPTAAAMPPVHSARTVSNRRPSTTPGPPPAPIPVPGSPPTTADSPPATPSDVLSRDDPNAAAIAAAHPTDPSAQQGVAPRLANPTGPGPSRPSSKDYGRPDDKTQSVIASEREKAAAERREIDGEEPQGTVVDGMEDDQLWVMLRRFNNQVNHVLHPARDIPPAEPDLRMTSLTDVPFRSDTLKANLERVIAAIGPPSVRGVRELERLTDWENERDRTAAYCTAYFISWAAGYTLFAAAGFACLLICFPKTRRVLFPEVEPPAGQPLSATDPANEKGDESVLGGVTGHGHRTKAEQAEEQAFEVRAVLVAFMSTVLLGNKGEEGNATVGPKDLGDGNEAGEGGVANDSGILLDETGKPIARKDSAAGPQKADAVVGRTSIQVDDDVDPDKVAENEVKRKRDELVVRMAKNTETSLGSIADTIEILQKALSPPPTYPDFHARFKIAALFIVPVIALHYIPAAVFGRMVTFSFGALLWGRELAERGMREFVRLVPNWRQLLDPRNSILSCTPTDAQLALHLLRVCENLGCPLPAAPTAPLDESRDAIKDPTNPDGSIASSLSDKSGGKPGPVKAVAQKTKVKTKNAFKKMTRKFAAIGSDVSVVGEENTLRNKIDEFIQNTKFGDDTPGGYRAKLGSSSGHVFIDDSDARLIWVPLLSKNVERVWYIDDLVEMKKDGVSTTRLALATAAGAEIQSLGLTLRFASSKNEAEAITDLSGQALSDKIAANQAALDERIAAQALDPDSRTLAVQTLAAQSDPLTADALAKEVLAAQAAEDTVVFKAVQGREELFNRLIAMGPQRWEML